MQNLEIPNLKLLKLYMADALNVLVAPKYKSELTSEVNFYIENDKGDKIKAVENFKLSKVNEPYVVNMSLNFKRYP